MPATMAQNEPEILILDCKIEPHQLDRLVEAFFDDMVKVVVDVRRRVVAVGGELHADAERQGAPREVLRAGSASGRSHGPRPTKADAVEGAPALARPHRPAFHRHRLQPREHDRAFRCLLTFTPAAYRQLPLVLGPA